MDAVKMGSGNTASGKGNAAIGGNDNKIETQNANDAIIAGTKNSITNSENIVLA